MSYLIAALDSPASEIRLQAAETISGLGQEAGKAVDALTQALEDEEPKVQVAAARTLGRLGPAAEPAIDALSQRVTEESETLALACIESLSGLGRTAQGAGKQLYDALGDSRSAIRSRAIEALAKCEPDLNAVVIAARKLLEDEDWTVRKAAGQTLASVGESARSAVPKLFELLGSEEDREMAQTTLRAIDAVDAEALPALIQALNSSDGRTVYFAAFFLGKLGPEAKAALPTLKKMLENANSRVRRPLERAIARIDTDEDGS